MTTILLVDDHSVVRMGLKALLSRAPGFEVIGEAATAREAHEKALALHPDVILMDVRLPDGSGIECCRAIREERPQVRVLMLTSYDDKDAAVAAVVAGAAGYILKQVEADELLRSIHLVSQGICLLDPQITRGVMEHLRSGMRSESGLDDLNEREQAILDLIGDGLTNREIAGRLFLAEKTVRNYVSSILQKLNLSNRTQAAALVSRNRLLGGKA
ncbi:MAG: response regulator [Bacillota bacterium]